MVPPNDSDEVRRVKEMGEVMQEIGENRSRIELDERARAARLAIQRAADVGELPAGLRHSGILKRLVARIAALGSSAGEEISQPCEPLHTPGGLARLIKRAGLAGEGRGR